MRKKWHAKKNFMKLNYIAVFHEYFFGLQCQYYWKNPWKYNFTKNNFLFDFDTWYISFFFNLDSRLERTFVSYHVQFRKNIARSFYELLLFFGFCMVCDDGRKNNHRFGSTRGWFCKLGIFFFKMFFVTILTCLARIHFQGENVFLIYFL